MSRFVDATGNTATLKPCPKKPPTTLGRRPKRRRRLSPTVNCIGKRSCAFITLVPTSSKMCRFNIFWGYQGCRKLVSLDFCLFAKFSKLISSPTRQLHPCCRALIDAVFESPSFQIKNDLPLKHTVTSKFVSALIPAIHVRNIFLIQIFKYLYRLLANHMNCCF